MRERAVIANLLTSKIKIMFAGILYFLIENSPVIFFLVGVSCAFVRMYRHRINIMESFVAEAFASYYLLFALGIRLLYGSIVQLLLPYIAAQSFAVQNNPFQIAVSILGIGLGIASVLAYKKGFRFRLRTVIACSLFSWGCAALHIFVQSGSYIHVPYSNVWTNILQPFISIAILRISLSTQKSNKLFHLANYCKPFFVGSLVSK